MGAEQVLRSGFCRSLDTGEAVGPPINDAHKHAILGEPEK